jgi:hypothetical protein
MKALGWQEAPVLVAVGRPEELFSAVCGNTKPVTATQWIDVYLKGGEVPSGPTRSNIRRLEETVGRDFLRKLANAGLSPQIWNVANRTIRYAPLDGSSLPNVLEWLLDHKITRQVAAWITGQNPPQELQRAFSEGRAPTF